MKLASKVFNSERLLTCFIGKFYIYWYVRIYGQGFISYDKACFLFSSHAYQNIVLVLINQHYKNLVTFI